MPLWRLSFMICTGIANHWKLAMSLSFCRSMEGRARVTSITPLQPLPVSGMQVALGFPSPAEDFEEERIDLNALLVRNPPATFLYRASGNSMIEAGICDGDILVVDRSITPKEGDIVIASWDGNQPVCKILHICLEYVQLISCNQQCPPIDIPAGTELEVFTVSGVVRTLVRRGHKSGMCF